MQFLEKKLDKYFLFCCLMISIPAVWALFIPGYFGASDDLHTAWLYEMDKSIKMFQIPPRFVPDLSFGFGYPLFNFVFPLPFYIGELFHLIGLNFVDSIKAIFFISVPLSMFFMYKLLREFTSIGLSFSGAVVYVYTPYRATDLYVRGAIGEILSFVFLPLIVLCLFKVWVSSKDKKNNSLRWIGVGGLAVAALILTHNITAYMFFMFLFLLIVILIFSAKNHWLENMKVFVSILFLGLLCSIYFWLPALTESSLVKYDTVFNFVDHFPTIKQLITPHFGYGASVPGPGDGMSFFIGVVNWILFLVSIPLLILFRKKLTKIQKVLIIWAVVLFILSFIMMNYRSALLWSNLPLIPYFQFPWRFLIITTFCTPLLIVILDKIPGASKLALLIIIGAILINYPAFRPQDFLGRTDEYYLKRYIPTPQVDPLYLEHREEYLRLPKDTQVRPDKLYPLITPESEEIKNFKKINDLDVSFISDFGQPTNLNYNKYYFPGWNVKINGQNTSINPGLPFGQITFIVPKGEQVVEVFYEETLFKRILDIISLLSIMFCVILALNKKMLMDVRKKINL